MRKEVFLQSEKKSCQNLAETLHLQAKLVESVSEAIISTDENFIIRSWNQGAAKMYGYTSEEAIGKHANVILQPGKTRKGPDEFIQHLIHHGQLKIETTHRRKNGEKLDVVSYIAPVYDDRGNIAGTVGIIYDVTEHKRLEETLARNREELEIKVNERTAELLQANEELQVRVAILDMTTDAIFMRDSGDNCVYANKAACEIFGYSRDELTGMNLRNLVAPAEIPSYDEKNRSFLHMREWEIEAYHQRKDMSVFLAEAKSQRINLGRSEFIITAIRDISERRKAEEQLRYQAMLVDSVSDAVVSTNINSQILSWNKAAETIYGWKQEEVLGKRIRDVILIEFASGSIGDLLEQLDKQGIWKGETIQRRKDGALINISGSVARVKDSSGIPVGNVAIYRDITEWKKTDEQLKQNELQLQTIFDAMDEGIALIGKDGRVIKSNAAEARILGLKSPEERIGQYFLCSGMSHVHADGRPLSAEETGVMGAMKRMCTVRNFEMGHVKNDGSILWLNVNAMPVQNRQGEIVAVIRTITDITEQKRLREEREEFTKRLLEAQEEERKRISRELHDDTAQYLSLLTLEMDSLLNREKIIPPEVLTRLNKMRFTAGKALQEIRRFAHELRPSVLEDFGLAAALELIVGEFKEFNQLVLNFELSGLERRLPDEIELVFFRIAQEAMSNIRKHSQATRAYVHLTFTNHKVKLTIADNGQGFISTKKHPAPGKSGLGLVGMRERAHLIGAGLKIKSSPSRGTVISVEIAQ